MMRALRRASGSGPSLRRLAKRSYEQVLVRSGAVERACRRRRRDTAILAYHNVCRHRPGSHGDGAGLSRGDASLHLTLDDFAAQMDALTRTHEVIPLDKLLGERDDEPERPRAVITFDDAYAGCLAHALPELARRGLPCTVFVAPALLGGVAWWDALASPARGELEPATRAHALSVLHGDGARIMNGAMPSAHLASELHIATEAALHSVRTSAGVTFGSHSWSHRNLPALAPDELTVELRDSRDWLSGRFGNFIPWISYPYGLTSAPVQERAAALGYAGGLRVDGGLATPRDLASPLAIPRVNIPAGVSVAGFMLRVSGLVA